MNPPPPSIPGRIRTLLRGGPFVRYVAGEGISMTGTWMQVMAQSWVMTTLTDRAAMLGLVNFAAGLPMLALTMLGGICADRFDKRNILLSTQVVQILLALLVGWLVATGQVHLWHIVGVAALLGISNSFEMPAAAALVPELVRKDQLATAIAIDRAVFHGTRLIGPAVAGYVIGLWGPASAFYVNALSFFALIISLLTIQPRAQGTAEEEAVRRTGLKEGLHFVRSDPPTLAMIAVMAATTIFVFPVMVVMLPLYARNLLLLGPDKMGLLMGLSSIGAVTGSIGLLAIPFHRRRELMLSAAIGASLAILGLSLARLFGIAAGCLILLSLSVSTLIGLANTIVQERAPGPLRGRVSAIAGLSFFGLMPFASLGITGLADAIGMRQALVVGSLAFFSITVALLMRRGRFQGDTAIRPLLIEPAMIPATEVEPLPAQSADSSDLARQQ